MDHATDPPPSLESMALADSAISEIFDSFYSLPPPSRNSTENATVLVDSILDE